MANKQNRLVGPVAMSATDASLYTVTSGQRVIIRQMHFSNPDTSAHTVTVSIGADAAGTRWFDSYTVGAGQVYDAFMILPLEAAENLRGHASSTSVTVTITGDILLT